MGRTKTIFVKTLGDQLIEEHGKDFTDDFEKNKKILSSIKKINSKKIRNILAGYITKEIKKTEKSGL